MLSQRDDGNYLLLNCALFARITCLPHQYNYPKLNLKFHYYPNGSI